MKVIVEHEFTGQTFGPTDTYDHTKTFISTHMRQHTGSAAADKWAGPAPISVVRFAECGVATSMSYPYVLTINDTYDWVFLGETTTAAANRRITLVEYNKITNVASYKGYINLSGFPGTGNITIRGLAAVRYLHSTGQVTLTNGSTTVTGNGSCDWVNQRMASGGRIGIGSTNPNLVSQWYGLSVDVAPLANQVSLAANYTGTTVGPVDYVIEDLWLVLSVTSAAANGLYVAKGLGYNSFPAGGLSVAAAGTTDNISRLYWFSDAATTTITAAAGVGIEETSTHTEHYCYVPHTSPTTTLKIYKFNLRAVLTTLNLNGTNGKTMDPFVLATGTVNNIPGAVSQANSCRIFTMSSGPGASVASLYIASTTRIYRCPLDQIISGSTGFCADAMAESPPGGAYTYLLSSTMNSVEYIATLDRLLISSLTAGVRPYITSYASGAVQFEELFGAGDRQIDQSTAAVGTTPAIEISNGGFSCMSENGYFYLSRYATTSPQYSQLYVIPLRPHYSWAARLNQLLITPALQTPGCTQYNRLYINRQEYFGSIKYSRMPEPFVVYYRTNGIEDNSGKWLEITDTNDLSYIPSSGQIQFAIAFKVLGLFCLSARIFSIGLVYEDDTVLSYYTQSLAKSNLASRVLAFQQIKAWGTSIPALRIRIYNPNGDLILDDTTTAHVYGVWQYSTDGTSWSAWNASADNVGNYIRYTANGLPNGIRAKVILSAT